MPQPLVSTTSESLFILVFGPEPDTTKNVESESGIVEPDPQHWGNSNLNMENMLASAVPVTSLYVNSEISF